MSALLIKAFLHMMSPPSPPHSLVQVNTPHPSVEWLSCEQEGLFASREISKVALCCA